jgi:hypothetical protein
MLQKAMKDLKTDEWALDYDDYKIPLMTKEEEL